MNRYSLEAGAGGDLTSVIFEVDKSLGTGDLAHAEAILGAIPSAKRPEAFKAVTRLSTIYEDLIDHVGLFSGIKMMSRLSRLPREMLPGGNDYQLWHADHQEIETCWERLSQMRKDYPQNRLSYAKNLYAIDRKQIGISFELVCAHSCMLKWRLQFDWENGLMLTNLLKDGILIHDLQRRRDDLSLIELNRIPVDPRFN